jgi:hypothetical protein
MTREAYNTIISIEKKLSTLMAELALARQRLIYCSYRPNYKTTSAYYQIKGELRIAGGKYIDLLMLKQSLQHLYEVSFIKKGQSNETTRWATKLELTIHSNIDYMLNEAQPLDISKPAHQGLYSEIKSHFGYESLPEEIEIIEVRQLK